MSELQEALRAYGERLAELVDAGATAAAEPRGWRGRRRVVLVAACIAIVGAAAALVAWRDEPGKVQPPAGEDTPAEPTDDALAGAWSTLPTQLGNGDSQPALLVTNDGLINLHSENGGNDVAGEIWAVGTDETTPFTPSGMVWRAFPSVAWTGTELVMAGGSNGPGVIPLAAAYDPVTDHWRELPDPPGIATGQSANEMTDGVWTGSELISWNSALAYAPESESWRTIEASPLSERSWAAVAATDDGVFVWGGCSPLPTSQCDEVSGEDELTDGALYDPQTDSWRRLAPSPLGPGDHPTAVWTGKEVIVNVPAPVNPNAPNIAAYDPTTDSWRALPDSPHPAGHYTEAVWTGRYLVLHGGVSGDGTPSGATSLLDLEREQWYRLPDGPPRGPHSIVAIDPTSVVIAGGYSDASPWLLEFVEPATEPSTASAEVEGIGVQAPSGWSTEAASNDQGDVLYLRDGNGAELHIVVRPTPPEAPAAIEVLSTISAFGDRSAVVTEVEGGYELSADLACPNEPCERIVVYGYNLSLDEFTAVSAGLRAIDE